MCVCACVCVRACVRACVCACVCVVKGRGDEMYVHVSACMHLCLCECVCMHVSMDTHVYVQACAHSTSKQLTHNIEDTGPAAIKSIFTEEGSDGEGQDVAHLTAGKAETAQFAALQGRCPLSPQCVQGWRDAAL